MKSHRLCTCGHLGARHFRRRHGYQECGHTIFERGKDGANVLLYCDCRQFTAVRRGADAMIDWSRWEMQATFCWFTALYEAGDEGLSEVEFSGLCPLPREFQSLELRWQAAFDRRDGRVRLANRYRILLGGLIDRAKLDDIGRELGVSRERVRQLAKRLAWCRSEPWIGVRLSVAAECARSSRTLAEAARRACCSKRAMQTALSQIGALPNLESRWSRLSVAKKRRRLSNQRCQVLNRIRDVGARLKRTPTTHDLGMSFAVKCYGLFGSLMEAQRLAGFEPRPPGGCGHINYGARSDKTRFNRKWRANAYHQGRTR